MGFAIAEECADAGAEVILVSGPVALVTANPSIKLIRIQTAAQMYSECLNYFSSCDAAILSAAVADFSPVETLRLKVKREKADWNITFKPTKDIAAELGSIKSRNQLLVGFALETDNETENAKEKLKRKNFDFIVLNSLNDAGAGFGTDTNKITIIDKNNNIDNFELKSKREVAVDIVNKLTALMRSL
jgi:phosphopantothenoylcysteine decarboxylase/phosphopantothenate--cysteine ligase